MKFIKIIYMLPLLAATLLFTACDMEARKNSTPQAEVRQAQRTSQQLAEADRQVGHPQIVNWQERKLAKTIFELRDRTDLICYAYLQSEYTGKLIYIGKCLGFGLPYSVQFTNPETVIDPEKFVGYNKYQGEGGFVTLPQADPNGLFMPQGLSATWLLMIDPETGDATPVYFEPTIVVSPFPLTQGVDNG